MVTTIGTSSDIVCISDNATPASGTYAWYLPASSIESPWTIGPLKESRLVTAGGISSGNNAFEIDEEWKFRDVPISTWTNYSNLRKALAYWSVNNTRLYLSITPAGWANNIAVVSRYDTPTTLVQFTGKLRNFRKYNIMDSQMMVSIDMYYEYYTLVGE